MTEPLIVKLHQLQTEAASTLTKVADLAQLEEWRVKYLGRKGELSSLIKSVPELVDDARREAGKISNSIKQELTASFAALEASLNQAMPSNHNTATVSEDFNQAEYYPGSLNPLTISIRRIYQIFTSMGFQLAEGPLLEEPSFNFDLLNIPLEHPARAATDTYYVEDGKYVLRTHTSPVQLRAVLENNLTPPFKIFSPGRVFRAERTDASHQDTFYQTEALMVGDNVTIADFKGIAEHFYSTFFDQTITSRLRPSFFPFVEPGFEVDISCFFCKQKGCRVCSQTGWIEVMGAGIVHPNVLKNMNIDPDKYQGFAFGSTIDRITMLRHGINNIRNLLGSDIKFLRQFPV